MTPVLHFSYFNKVYNHFYIRNCNDKVFHNFYNLKCLNLHAHVRLYKSHINPYPTAFPYGNGTVLHFYQQQESSTTKTVHKVINKGLKAYVLSPHTGENFH